MKKRSTLSKYYDYVIKLSRIGFNSVYQNDTFTVTYSKSMYSVCSIELDVNGSILISLVSPYLSENKYVSSLNELFDNFLKMDLIPVRNINLRDLPILSKEELLKLGSNNSVKESDLDLKIVSLDSKGKLKDKTLTDDEYFLKERLEIMPDDIKELVGYKVNKITTDYINDSDKKICKIYSYKNITNN
mgnify:CR=1 FL=1